MVTKPVMCWTSTDSPFWKEKKTISEQTVFMTVQANDFYTGWNIDEENPYFVEEGINVAVKFSS